MSDERNHYLTEPSGLDAEPVAKTKFGTFLTRIVPPKGASYNKNVILLVIFGILIAFAITILLSILAKKSSNSPASSSGEQSGTGSQDLTPAELTKLPDHYSLITDGRSTVGNGTNLTKQPGPSGQDGWPNSSIHSQTGNRNDQNNSDSIQVPPTVQPITTGQSAVTGDWSGSGQPELTAGYKSPIRFGNDNPSATMYQKTENGVTGDFNKLTGQLLNPNGNLPTVSTQQESDQNLQDEKRNFNNPNNSKQTYASTLLTPPLSPYELKAGSIVPVVLITGLNSDLPGNLIAQVRENVYDTVSGRYLLIPQGTKVIGVYDSKVAYAQSRALVNWTRLIFPNGYSQDLQNLSGIDQSGHTGLKDRVNNHTGKLVTGIFLTSILGASVEMAQGSSGSNNQTYDELAAQGASQALQQAGNKLVQKDLDVQPTLEIRPGFLFNLFIDKDFILKPYQR